MVAPGFRSRIATGLLAAAVVLPVPIGATSAVAADRRATPVDRPPHLARPGDPPDDVPGAAGADGFGLDGYGADDFTPGPPPAEGPGAGAGRARAGHPGHPGAPAHLPELPDRFPGLPHGLPGFPHRSPHHHFGGSAGTDGGTTTRITRSAPATPCRARRTPPREPTAAVPTSRGTAATGRPPRRVRPTPTVRTRGPVGMPRSRSAASLRRPKPLPRRPLRHGRPLRDASTSRTGSPGARTRRCRHSRRPPRGRTAPHRRARMTHRRPRRARTPWRPPGPRSSGFFRWGPALLSPVWGWPSSPCGCAGTDDFGGFT